MTVLDCVINVVLNLVNTKVNNEVDVYIYKYSRLNLLPCFYLDNTSHICFMLLIYLMLVKNRATTLLSFSLLKFKSLPTL